MIAESEIKKMSVAERLQTIEALWQSLPNSHASVDSPSWHGEVLSARKAKVDSGQAEFLSLDAVRKRLLPTE